MPTVFGACSRTIALVGLLAQASNGFAASSVVLLRDTFDAATGGTTDLNVDLARQSGSLAPLSYTLAGGAGHYGHQLQNGNALNQLLVADFPNSTSSLNVNFNGANSAGGLVISFDLDSIPSVYGGTPDNWGCINLGMSAADQLANVNQGVAHLGILFRGSGTIQAFDGGSVVSPGAEPVFSTNPPGTANHIDLVITDADGNPFDGVGNTTIEVFANGGTTPVWSFTKVGGYANNYINVQGSFRAHFDNLQVARRVPGIENPSFEANSFTVFPGYASGNGTIVGWTAAGGAGLNPAGGSPFADNGTIPNGSQVAFIQNGADSALSTVLSDLSAGQAYKVNFRVNARSGNTPNLKVEIDGNNVITTAVTPVGGANAYKYFAFDFTATSGSHTMTLRSDSGGDNTVVLDDFSIAARNSGWSYAAWTDDSAAGIDSSKPYTHAYNFGTGNGATIEGITFTGASGANPSVAGRFSTAGFAGVFPNDGNNLNGGSRQLANDFVYGGPAQSLTLSGLLIGAEYVANIYSVGWENGTRAATFSGGSDRLTVNQDHFGDNNGIRFTYRFTATQNSITLNFDQLEGNSIHVYGFSNYELTPPAVPTPPIITAQPQDAIIGLGSTATFTVAAIGSAPLTYQWYFGSDLIVGETSPTLNVPVDFPDQAGDYNVLVSNSAGSIASRNAKLTVRARVPGLFDTGVDDSGAALADNSVDTHYTLIVNADSASTDALVQNSGAFPIVSGPWLANTATSKWIGPRFDTTEAAGLAQGNGIYVYRISFDLTGLDRSSVLITGGWAIDNGGLSISVNGITTGVVNNNGFGGATPFTLSSANAAFVEGVNTLDFEVQNVDVTAGYTGLRVVGLRGLAELPGTPPSIVQQPQGGTFGTAESVTLTVIASGSSPLNYQWRKGGANISGANGPSLTFTPVTHADAGAYSVFVSNSAGNITSADAVIVVRDSVTTFFHTGVDETGNALADGTADAHYTIVVNPDSAAMSAIVEDSTVFPISTATWVANNARSKWVGPRLETSGAAGAADSTGDYLYRTLVDLTGFDPATVTITGDWSTDNEGLDILVNGVSTGQRNTTQFPAFTPFTINSGLLAGVNVIEFKLNNSAVGYTGLRVDHVRALGTALPPGTPPFIVQQPQNVIASPGERVTFSVRANGSPTFEYQWYYGLDPILLENGPSLSFAFDFEDQIGDYSVEIISPFGSVRSAAGRLSLPAPVLSCPGNIVAECTGGLTPVIFTATATDAAGVPVAVTCTPPSGSGFRIGQTTVECVAGNPGSTASCSFVVSVVDTTPPVIRCNENIVADATSADGAIVNYVTSASDPCGLRSLECLPNGNVFPVGVTTVTCTTIDGSGLSSSCSFTVTVRSFNQAPTAQIVADQLVEFSPDFEHPVLISCNWWNSCLKLDGSLSSDPENSALTYLWFTEPAVVPFATSAVVTNCFELGTHTIVLTATDSEGASDADTLTIEVVTAPLAVELLMEKINESLIPRRIKRELIATLRIALNHSKENRLRLTQTSLSAFERKVRAQVVTGYPALAAEWIRWSQNISTGMENCIKPPAKPKTGGKDDDGDGNQEPN